MTSTSLIAVSGPSGSGKTTWISQFLSDRSRPTFYLYPGLGNISVDLARIGYRFPWVQVICENEVQHALKVLPDNAIVYVELGFHMDLRSPFFDALPCHRIAVLPPQFPLSDWHDWADEVVVGNDMVIPQSTNPPELWRTALTGQIFDPPSLDEILIELTGGAYGTVHRMKGIFEMPDGVAFYVDFLKSLPGLEYTELSIPRWLEGRPNRFSGIEVVGWNLEQEAITQTLLDGWLSDEAIAHYQQQYKSLSLAEEAISV